MENWLLKWLLKARETEAEFEEDKMDHDRRKHLLDDDATYLHPRSLPLRILRQYYVRVTH